MYKPIDCNFYDILEASSVLRKVVIIEYFNEKEEQQTISNRIVDLFIRNKAEYMRLENGAEIRLDKIHSVDGNILQGFCKI